ncbi:MAG: hypothetical protein QNJ69_11015 [Gammaproteobacteria bacterium]|nr:hypothetical protein [Gammaproteobacteria bacterium]
MANEQSPFHGLEVEDNPVLKVSAQEQTLQQDLEQHMQHFRALPDACDEVEKAKLMLDIAECHLGLDQQAEAHDWARDSFVLFIEHDQWQSAVDACDIIYNSNQDDALVALANGIWLAVTFPIDPNVSVQLLHYIVDETPDDSDGAAVAAMLAHYLAETRSSDKDHKNLTFLSNQIIAQVAKRHRGIEDEQTLQTWIKMYELDDIEKLLPKMAVILETIVDDDWWYDRDAIRERLPIN